MSKEKYVIGVDFGTDSVRAILACTSGGEELASAVFIYPRWADELYCDPEKSVFRQHPLDYLEGLTYTIRQCVSQVGATVARNVCGISVDTTGSTPIAVGADGVPLSLHDAFRDNPNAMFVLWKDHSAKREAAEINAHHHRFEVDYLKYVGGIYSAEWYWAKLLHVLRADPAVRRAIYTWVEHCDWVPFLLTGGKQASQLKRGVCSAGHKSLWAEEFGGYPPNTFFSSLDPLLDGFVDRLPHQTYHAAHAAGNLCQVWADKLGLSTNVTVGIGAFDCHMGAVGGEISPYYLSKVIGTSTCDIAVVPTADMEGRLVKGICGQVHGSVIPGMIGLEAGQSAFGDAYAWFRKILEWPLRHLLDSTPGLPHLMADEIRNHVSQQLINQLSAAADKLPVLEDDELAVDWLNGRRTPDANQYLKGSFLDLHVGTDTPRMFRALAQGTVFGARSINDRFLTQGVPIKGIIALGGIPKKSPYIMQMMADVLGMTIKVHRSEQTCAIGAAMFAATAAGVFPRVEEAMGAMGQGFGSTYQPREAVKAVYDKLYDKYLQSGEFIERLSNKSTKR